MNYSLFGAAFDTGNLGVSALCYSVLNHFVRSVRNPASITVFDYSSGRTPLDLQFQKHPHRFFRQGAFLTRRFYRSESLLSALVVGYFGGLGNPVVSQIRKSAVILDISGGDSFTDLYGEWRFRSTTIPKQLALWQRKSLVLLPQTYGPFRSKKNRDMAADIARRAKYAVARDERSYQALIDLLGADYDPERHLCGVDVAFSLPAKPPVTMTDELSAFISNAREAVIGLNISGLLYNEPNIAQRQFGLRGNYRNIIQAFLSHIVHETKFNILLVPHVAVDERHRESDLRACRQALATAGSSERILIAPEYRNPCEVKWLISQMAWFCGTRMHSTIAALSSSTPAAAIAYSPKTAGVFESCGLGAHVADPTRQNDAEVLLCLLESLDKRREVKEAYLETMPAILKRSQEQFSTLLG